MFMLRASGRSITYGSLSREIILALSQALGLVLSTSYITQSSILKIVYGMD